MTLEISDVEVVFGAHPALCGVSAVLEPGKITALVGPNAAGKTTLLRCVAGVLTPDRGEVRLDGTSIQSLSPSRRAGRIAYLGQRSTVVGGHSAADVVAFGGLGRHRDEARIQEELDQVGLRTESDRPFQELSAGQQQRVALARTMYQVGAGTGGWLILDEPFAAQDPKEVVRILERLSAWRASGNGALIAIHDLRVARAISDRAILLRSGRQVAVGDRAEVLAASVLSDLFEVAFDETPSGPIARFPGAEERGTE